MIELICIITVLKVELLGLVYSFKLSYDLRVYITTFQYSIDRLPLNTRLDGVCTMTVLTEGERGSVRTNLSRKIDHVRRIM